MTEALGKERGRPVYLAARVAGSLEMCRQIGYDIPAWIEEGLVDILIPAGNAVTDASVDVTGFVRLCEGTDIAVYPDTGNCSWTTALSSRCPDCGAFCISPSTARP